MDIKGKINNYLGLILLIFIMIILCGYHDLFYPEVMMRKCSYIFDQYNTSGVVWTFWKIVSEITRVLTLITIILNMLAIVASIRRSVSFKRIFIITIATNILNVIWLFCLTLAEKLELIFHLFAKIFCAICRIEYNPNTKLYLAVEKLTFFGDRLYLLGIVVLLIIFCIVWVRKRETLEIVPDCYGKISIFLLTAGFMHFLFNLSTESHFLYSLLGVPESKWEYWSGVENAKIGFSFFFFVPVMMILVAGIILFLYNKLSKPKLLLIGFGLLIVNIIIVLAGILSQIAENAEYAKKAGRVYYSLSIKKAMVTECFGLFVFEIIVLVCLVDLISEERSFLQSMAVLICTLIVSMAVMRFIGRVDAFGLIFGLAGLVIYLIFVLVKFLEGKVLKGKV